jgi:acetylornithine/succinyldiaminopimelate/putrescine aminotransferase
MKVLNLPGPIAKSIIERDQAVVSPSYPRGVPFVMDHGRGVEVWDVDGNRFLDFAAGIAVTSTGPRNSFTSPQTFTMPNGWNWQNTWTASHLSRKMQSRS